MRVIPLPPKVFFRWFIPSFTDSPNSYMRRERPDHTLQATALINEAYIRLVGDDVDWNSRSHFIGLAARVMRQVLVDFARAHAAERRAGGLRRVEMQDNLAIAPERLQEIMPLDEALTQLAAINQPTPGPRRRTALFRRPRRRADRAHSRGFSALGEA